MQTYKIEYLGKSMRSRGEDAMDAIRRYGARMVYGRHPIFVAVYCKYVDSDTRGHNWAIGLCDGIKVSAEIIPE